MVNQIINIRIPEGLLSRAREIVNEGMFSSVNDFVRNALREKIDKYNKNKLIMELKALQGSVKGIRKPTPEERRKNFEEFCKKDTSQLFREFGLD